MAAINWTQDEWIDFFEKFGPLMSIYWMLYDDVLVMEGNDVWLWERLGDQFSNWQITGIKLGENTDGDGNIHVSIAALYGGTTVSLYNNSARTFPYLIAQGTRVGAGAVTFSEMNSSGVSGTVDMDDTTATAVIYLEVVQGFLAQINNLTEYDQFDAQVKALLKEIGPNITGGYIGAVRNIKYGVLDILRGFAPDKLGTAEYSTVMFVETQATNGTVTVEFTGIGKYLINAMDDQVAPAGVQTVYESNPWGFTDSVDPNNVGSGVLTWAPYDHARAGDFTLECVSGGTIGAEEFEVSEKSDEGTRITGSYRLKVAGVYRSVNLGISEMSLSRDVTEVLDPENRFSGYGISGVNASNSNGGNLYFTYDRVGDILYAYSDATRLSMVAKAVGIAGGGGPVAATLLEENDSGLTAFVTFNGTDPTTDLYDFQALASTFAKGDRFYSQLTEDGGWNRGMINTFFGRLFGLVLPSSTPETILDGIANRGFGRRSDRWT
jgi:hypothetical protein